MLNDPSLSDWLNVTLARRRLTLSQAAELTGLSVSFLGKLARGERGAAATDITLKAIAKLDPIPDEVLAYQRALHRIVIARRSKRASFALGGGDLRVVPNEIGKMTHLRELRLEDCQLHAVPPGVADLQDLNTLRLSGSQVTSLPPEIGKLTNLTALDLRSNQLTSLPPEIGKLTSLTTLDLRGNHLTSLPPEIGKLTNLTTLLLYNNQLTSLPPEIGKLSNLTGLDLEDNQLTALTRDIGGLSNLKVLYLEGNQLTSVPSEIGKLTNLKELRLHGNQLTLLPSEIGKFTNLTTLTLQDNQLTSLPPEIGKLTNLTELHLDRNQLASLPPEIGKLANLTTLRLGGNRLTSLPPEIGELTSLIKLNLNGNNLAAVPAEIGKLSKLMTLLLVNNQLTSLPAEIGKLTDLAMLDLQLNQVTSLPPAIGELTNLTTLWVHNNQLTSFPSQIGKLTKLTTLSLSVNQFTSLPPEIGKLTSLTQLYLHKNQFTSLPPEIGKLNNLMTLDLQANQLTSLPPEIGKLTKLTVLWLGRNQLASLPPDIGELTNLTALYLSNNRLTSLPREIGKLTNLTQLYLQGNDALGLPPEVLGPHRGDVVLGDAKPAKPADILAYYFRRQSESKRRLNEAKLLLVGQGGVGKTSLVRFLVQNKKARPKQGKTEGIDITGWKVPSRIEGEEIRLNVWDFGGQEIMHATHQFFLTRRSLYLVVLDARKGENEGNLHYWLRIIQSFGGDSPVIVVTNQCDGPNDLDLNERRLAADYDNIQGFIKTSCATGRGIEDLRAIIERQVNELPHVFDELPQSYFAIKDQLANQAKSDDYLDVREYQAVCVGNTVTEEDEQERLLRFLHDLGIVLNYNDPKDPYHLRDTHILNPKWVTNGVYRILNSDALRDAHGVLDCDALGDILTDTKAYPKDRRDFIVGMMRSFELCFDFPDTGARRVLVPERLPENEPEGLKWNPPDALRFEYHYTVLPGGVIPRFIVRTNRLLTDPPQYWRSGAVLNVDGVRVLVRGDTQKGRVFITVAGRKGVNAVRRREALSAVRDQFREIHATIPRLEVLEKIPLPDHPELRADFATLLTMEASGRAEYWPDGAEHGYSVIELLASIEDPKHQRSLSMKEVADSMSSLRSALRGIAADDEKGKKKRRRS